MSRLFVATLFMLGCSKTDPHCVEWTETADACLEAAGEAPAYVAGVDCARDDAAEDMHKCLEERWEVADCSTPENVAATEASALEDCIP